MKNLTHFTNSVALLLIALGSYAQQGELPKAFYKGCLVTSITGGPSRALFTSFSNDGEKVHSDFANGVIDPLIMEYAITNKIGVGFSKGGEYYDIDANKFYKADAPEGSNMMWTRTNYFTLDYSYHPFVSKRIDVSLFGSLGYFKVSGQCYTFDQNLYSGPAEFNYNGKGAVVRAGLRSRLYFSKRFGLMAMGYCFNGIAKEKQKPNPISDQINNSGYTTMITGAGLEFGLCFRIFKQKNVMKELEEIERSTKVKDNGLNSASISGLFGADSF